MTSTPQKTAPSHPRVKQVAWVASVTLVSLVGFLAFFSAWWYVYTYGRIGFDSIMFTLTGNLNGVNVEHIISYILGGALPALVCTALMCLPLYLPQKKRRFLSKLVTAVAIVLSMSLTVHAAFNVDLVDYIITGSQETALYDDYYTDPRDVSVTFPEEKRNLIYIVLESMETSYLSSAQGGGLKENLIPELYALAQNNINFSHNSDVGGFREVPGASWTIGALVSQTAGISLKTPSGGTNDYGGDGSFLPGVYTLFNILQEQGYYQALMVGSDAEFGGRKPYYLSHGVDEVFDLYTAWEDGLVEHGYNNNFWGIEDSQLYAYAKDKLTQVAQGDAPFAFTLLTVDTHSPSGYTCDLCQNDHKDGYANVISCADRQLADFMAWLQQQDFYENTTVVIVGDHGSMNNGFFVRNTDSSYIRHVYNCFINASATPVTTQNRQFAAMDMFPTTLAALGCTIEGERLGLGTNLFSAEPTLMEQFGYRELCVELNKRSEFYEDKFYKEP